MMRAPSSFALSLFAVLTLVACGEPEATLGCDSTCTDGPGRHGGKMTAEEVTVSSVAGSTQTAQKDIFVPIRDSTGTGGTGKQRATATVKAATVEAVTVEAVDEGGSRESSDESIDPDDETSLVPAKKKDEGSCSKDSTGTSGCGIWFCYYWPWLC